MKKRYYLLLMLIVPILAVKAQASGCPPDCSQESITDSSYSNPESYKSNDFYRNSDPKKWDFGNPNFDYKKIPTEKYKYLPYDNPNIDHDMLDPKKYITAMGCDSCTFGKSFVSIKYSQEGVYHPKTGLAKNLGSFPQGTMFYTDQKTIYINLPSDKQQNSEMNLVYKYNIRDVGNAVINAKQGIGVIIDNKYAATGTITLENNNPYVDSGQNAEINGVKIISKGERVEVIFGKVPSSGNYVSFEEKEFNAAGKNFDLQFTGLNHYVEVYDSRHDYDQGYPTTHNQDDYLYISMGDEKSKSGQLKLTAITESQLPVLQTDGYVRMWNDRNDITIDGKDVINRYDSFSKIGEGSVSMKIVSTADTSKIYALDENRRIIAMSREIDMKLANLRSSITNDHNVAITGYFDESDLRDFKESLRLMQDNLDISFKKIEQEKGQKIVIHETDINLKGIGYEGTIAGTYLGGANIFWFAKPRDNPNRVQTYSNTPFELTQRTLTHEMGHILTTNDLKKEFVTMTAQNGEVFEEDSKGKLEGSKGPIGKFYENVNEFMAESFVDTVETAKTKKSIPEGSEIYKNSEIYKKYIQDRKPYIEIWKKYLQKYKE